MTRIGHDQNRPMIRIGFYGTASDIAQWEESLDGRLPPFEIVELAVNAVLILTRHRDQLPLSAAISASVGSAAGASACWRR